MAEWIVAVLTCCLGPVWRRVAIPPHSRIPEIRPPTEPHPTHYPFEEPKPDSKVLGIWRKYRDMDPPEDVWHPMPKCLLTMREVDNYYTYERLQMLPKPQLYWMRTAGCFPASVVRRTSMMLDPGKPYAFKKQEIREAIKELRPKTIQKNIRAKKHKMRKWKFQNITGREENILWKSDKEGFHPYAGHIQGHALSVAYRGRDHPMTKQLGLNKPADFTMTKGLKHDRQFHVLAPSRSFGHKFTMQARAEYKPPLVELMSVKEARKKKFNKNLEMWSKSALHDMKNEAGRRYMIGKPPSKELVKEIYRHSRRSIPLELRRKYNISDDDDTFSPKNVMLPFQMDDRELNRRRCTYEAPPPWKFPPSWDRSSSTGSTVSLPESFSTAIANGGIRMGDADFKRTSRLQKAYELQQMNPFARTVRTLDI